MGKERNCAARVSQEGNGQDVTTKERVGCLKRPAVPVHSRQGGLGMVTRQLKSFPISVKRSRGGVGWGIGAGLPRGGA